jgi:hypothetical protein
MSVSLALALVAVAAIVGFLVYFAMKPDPVENRGSNAFKEILPLVLAL